MKIVLPSTSNSEPVSLERYDGALLVPDRPSLARWLAHAARDRVQLTGLSDHAVSEAIYLRDPDRSYRKSSSNSRKPSDPLQLACGVA